MPHKITLRTAIGQTVSVDRDSGAILNVAVITVGKTKPSANGMDSFDIDGVSLQQVSDAINASEVGVKSRMTHPEVNGEDDITRRVGYIRNARIEGGSVRADMYFHNPTSDSASVLFSIAESDPESCGLSIVSNSAFLEKSEQSPTGIVLRLDSIDAVDWVGEPAANPAGMLSAKLETAKDNRMLTPEQIAFLTEAGLPEGSDEAATTAFIEALDEVKGVEYAALATEEEEVATLEADEDKKPDVAAGEGKDEDDKKPAVMSAKDINAAVGVALKADRTRTKQIQGIALKAGKSPAWVAQQIDSDTSVGDIALSALNTLNRGPNDMTTSKTTVGADNNRDTLGQAVQDAILLRAGVRQFVKTDARGGIVLSADRRPEIRVAHERASEFRGKSIIDMGKKFLISLGYHKADNMGRAELATLLMSRHKLAAAMPGVFLAQSTSDFSFILADTMGKVLRQEYALAPDTWSQWCRSTTAPDYKDVKKLQLSEAASLEVVPEGDEYTYATLTESKETYALSKYGKGIQFTREMLINDDLSAFDSVPRKMGRAAARKVETLAIAVLTANAALADTVALFHASHANLGTGALSVSSLGSARSLLRKQTALGSDDPLELTPRFLLVPESISTTAEQLIGSTVDPSLSNAAMNPFANKLQVIPSARLDSDSAAQWYLLADPSEIDTVEIAFLEGEETPVVEEKDEFDSDVRKVKVRHNIAAKAIDYRGMVRSSGA